jgi:anti-anti-sigma factor
VANLSLRGYSAGLWAVVGQRGVDAMSDERGFDVTTMGGVTVVRFRDRKVHDQERIEKLGRELFELVEGQNRHQLVLNFLDVDFISSATLGKLIVLDRKIKAVNGQLRMCHVSPEILEVFRVTRLDKVFDIRGEESEALAAF